MLVHYLRMLLHEPLSFLRILRVHYLARLSVYLQHAFLHHAHLLVYVLRDFHRILQYTMRITFWKRFALVWWPLLL